MKRFALFGALALAFISGPAFADTTVAVTSPVTVSSSPSFSLTGLEQTATVDLQAALADANAHNDTVAAQCYSALLAYQGANPVVLPATPVGVASGFQAARDVTQFVENQSSNGIPQPILIGCGPLALSIQNDLGKAANAVGGLGINIFGLKL